MKDFVKATIESYDKTVDEFIKNVEGLSPFKESTKFLSLIGKKAVILDLGCGPGIDAEFFAGKGIKVIGIDLSEKMIESAVTRVNKADFHVMDIRKLRFNDNHFNGIWASASYLHIPKKDIPIGLNESFRVLKKNGILYLSVKEGKGEMLLPDDRYNGVEKFWSFFQKDEIEKQLKKAGFNIIESRIEKYQNSYSTNPWIQILCKK